MNTNLQYYLRLFFLGLIIHLLGSDNLTAQVCPGGTIILSSQADVDNFPQNCTIVNGDLIIEGADIVDLSPLTNIEEVTGSLVIRDNPMLTVIDGFGSLQIVRGDLAVISNDSLVELSGFQLLTLVEEVLEIFSNASLTKLNGFLELRSVGFLLIRFNASLTQINAFSSLITVRDVLYISFNPQLFNCCGFKSLLSKGDVGRLILSDNAEGCNSQDDIEACPEPEIVPIPTLGEWGLILFSLMLLIVGVTVLKEQQLSNLAIRK